MRSATEDVYTLRIIFGIIVPKSFSYPRNRKLIENKEAYAKMANAVNPYGDGLSSIRTIKIIKNFFGFTNEKVDELIQQQSLK